MGLGVAEFWIKDDIDRHYSLSGHLFHSDYLMKDHEFLLQILPMAVDVVGIHRHRGYKLLILQTGPLWDLKSW